MVCSTSETHTEPNPQVITQKERYKAVIRASVWKTVAGERPSFSSSHPKVHFSEVEIYCGEGLSYEDDDGV